MTSADFRLKMKQVLDQVDTGQEILITRGGKVYKIVRVN